MIKLKFAVAVPRSALAVNVIEYVCASATVAPFTVTFPDTLSVIVFETKAKLGVREKFTF